MMLEWLATHAQQAVEHNGGNGDAAMVERVLAGSFALRGLVPLLLARSLTSSRAFLSIFVSRLVAKQPSVLLPTKPNPKPFNPPGGSIAGVEAQQLYLTASSSLNFAQMTLAMASQAVEHKKRTQGSRAPDGLRDAWIGLVQQFERESEGDDEDDFVFEVCVSAAKLKREADNAVVFAPSRFARPCHGCRKSTTTYNQPGDRAVTLCRRCLVHSWAAEADLAAAMQHQLPSGMLPHLGYPSLTGCRRPWRERLPTKSSTWTSDATQFNTFVTLSDAPATLRR